MYYGQYNQRCNFEMMIVKELGKMKKQAVTVSFNCYTRMCLKNEYKTTKTFLWPISKSKRPPGTNRFTTAFENK